MRTGRIFLISVICVTFFAGCLNMYQEVSLNPDGSGTLKLHYWTSVIDSVAEPAINQLAYFNEDSLRSGFSSQRIQIEHIAVERDTVNDTLHSYIEISFEHIDSLNDTRAASGSTFSLQDGAAGQKIFTQTVQPVFSGIGLNADNFSVTYVYDFPGEIITHNAVSRAKKKLVWSYTLAELGRGKTISVTYRPFKLKETPVWIYILSGAVLLIVVFFLFKKRRN